MPKNIYIHIPFCSKICNYCGFSRVKSNSPEQHMEYFQALKKEIKKRVTTKGEQITTLYFGGGTPSLIGTDILADFFMFLKTYFDFDRSIEVTMEANPETLMERNIIEWKKMGVTRLSIGVQTFQEKFSEFLGRKPLRKDFPEMLEIIKKNNLDISLDLIFGFPGQTLKDIHQDLQYFSDLGVDHISYYALDFKETSAIHSKRDSSLPFKTICSYYSEIGKQLKLLGYNQYEIYNYSKTWKFCKHNYDFWKNLDYMSFGLSSVSLVNNKVVQNVSSLKAYLGEDFCKEQYELDANEKIEMYLKRSLRLSSGLNISMFQKNCTFLTFDQIIEKTKKIPKFIIQKNDCLCLTEKGKMNFSEVIDSLFFENQLA